MDGQPRIICNIFYRLQVGCHGILTAARDRPQIAEKRKLWVHAFARNCNFNGISFNYRFGQRSDGYQRVIIIIILQGVFER